MTSADLSGGLLITGGTGFVGSHIARQVLRENVEGKIILYDLFPNLNAVKDLLKNDRVVLERADITDFATLSYIARKHEVTNIIHTAALLGGVAESNIYTGMKINVEGYHNVMELERVLDVNKVVWASSASVYGFSSTPGNIMYEDSPKNPTAIYAMSKLYCEMTAEKYYKNYGLKSIALRLPMVFGPDRNYSPKSFDISIFETPLRNQPITVGEDEYNLTGDWLYVKDAANAFYLSLFGGSPDFSIYNVGGETKTIGEMIGIIKNIIPSTKVEIDKQSKKTSRGSITLSSEKITRELNYKPIYGVEKGVKDYIESLRNTLKSA